MDEGDIEGRAELARFLGKEIWPADKETVMETARSQRAPENVLAQLDRAPERTYTNLAELWAELGGSNEEQRS